MNNFSLEELSVWETLKATTEPIIMYGTGNGADKVFSALFSYGITVSGVTASDGFVRERRFHDFKVQPVSYFEKIYDSFTIIVTFGSQQKSVLDYIKSLSEKHRVLFPCVPVAGDDIFDRDFVEKHSEELDKAYSLLSDEQSKRVFASYVNFEFSGKPEYLFNMATPVSETYENCIPLSDKENYVDIGAYRGDTVDLFLSLCGGRYSSITAVEPDRKSFDKLAAHCAGIESFTAVNAAVTDYDGTAEFSVSGGRQSKLGTGEKITATTLLTLCDKRLPTYIKIDAEGAEKAILEGGCELIKDCAPKLNIAVYHRNEDIFSVILLLNKYRPDYKLFLRHYECIPAWDTLLFAYRKK